MKNKCENKCEKIVSEWIFINGAYLYIYTSSSHRNNLVARYFEWINSDTNTIGLSSEKQNTTKIVSVEYIELSFMNKYIQTQYSIIYIVH